jgi:hypothetical protein
MLLALIWPLQSFARVQCGAPDAVQVAAHQHCAGPAGSPTGDFGQHHHCGSCCVAAAVSAPIRFMPPVFIASGISLPAHRSLLEVALDRLDRPPRLVNG